MVHRAREGRRIAGTVSTGFGYRVCQQRQQRISGKGAVLGSAARHANYECRVSDQAAVLRLGGRAVPPGDCLPL